MSASQTAIAILLAICGLALISIILSALFQSLLPGLRALPERMRVRRKQRLLAEVDALLEREALEQALPLLRQSFILEPIQVSIALVDISGAHNIAVLSRMLSVAEHASRRLDSMAVLEDLLANRQILMKSYFEIRETVKKLKRKRPAAGKEVPSWALSEFSKKLSDFSEKIETNKKSIETQLAESFSSLSGAAIPSEVTYH